ncbi:MAG: hypothetical protein SFW66_04460 [Gammaproteobacteria bacterium]|nr:hypothetical protein [Gammaproteobacteria bacterium]
MLRLFCLFVLSFFYLQSFAMDSADLGKSMIVSTNQYHNMAQVPQPKMEDVSKQAGDSMADRIRWTYNTANQCNANDPNQTLCYIALSASEKSTMKQLVPAECPQGYESILRFGKAVRNKDSHTIPPELLQYTPADLTNYVDQNVEAFYVAHDYSCDSLQGLRAKYNDDPDLLALFSKRDDRAGTIEARAHGVPAEGHYEWQMIAGPAPRTAFPTTWTTKDGVPVVILPSTIQNFVPSESDCRDGNFNFGPEEDCRGAFSEICRKVSHDYWCTNKGGIYRHSGFSRWVVSTANYHAVYCARPAGYFPVPITTSTATPLPVPDDLNNPAPTVVMCAKKDASNAETFWRQVT